MRIYIKIFIIAFIFGTSFSHAGKYEKKKSGSAKVPKGPYEKESTYPDPSKIKKAAEKSDGNQKSTADNSLAENGMLCKSNSSNQINEVLQLISSADTVEMYSPLFVEMNIAEEFTNPYDPEDIKVYSHFVTPDDSTIIHPCFYKSGDSSNSLWEARFTPAQKGEYIYYLIIENDGNTSYSPTCTLFVKDSDRNGFLHKNPESNYSFLFDSGKRFRGVGENFCWEDDVYNYENMLSLLEQENCNFIRTWMCPWNLALEWTKQGPVHYNETSAQELDTLLKIAQKRGIYILLVLDYHGVFKTEPDYWGANDYWTENPYYTENNGYCGTPSDFFTNSQARADYKKRLRYIIARWGYSPNIAAFEFYNEIDNTIVDEGVAVSDVADWHQDMAEYFKSKDPFNHLLCTSLSHHNYPEIWNIGALDFTQQHLYGATDDIESVIKAYNDAYGKPFVVGEFARYWEGPGSRGTRQEYTRELHIGLWRGMFSPTPVLPLTWWWDWHEEWGDYHHFGAASIFAKDMISENNNVLNEISVNAGEEFETMALETGDSRYLWIRNNISDTVKSKVFDMGAAEDEKYIVWFFDTENGTYYSQDTLVCAGGTIDVTLPDLAPDEDVACKVMKEIMVSSAGKAERPDEVNNLKINTVRKNRTLCFNAENNGQIKISILNASGKRLYNDSRYYQKGGNRIDLPVDGFSYGLYLICINTENFKQIKKCLLF